MRRKISRNNKIIYAMDLRVNAEDAFWIRIDDALSMCNPQSNRFGMFGFPNGYLLCSADSGCGRTCFVDVRTFTLIAEN